jgi:hypothetical protein
MKKIPWGLMALVLAPTITAGYALTRCGKIKMAVSAEIEIL